MCRRGEQRACHSQGECGHSVSPSAALGAQPWASRCVSICPLGNRSNPRTWEQPSLKEEWLICSYLQSSQSITHLPTERSEILRMCARMSRFWIFASKITCLVDLVVTPGILLDIEKLWDHTEAVSFHNFWRLILVQHFVLLSHQNTILVVLGTLRIVYFLKV